METFYLVRWDDAAHTFEATRVLTNTQARHRAGLWRAESIVLNVPQNARPHYQALWRLSPLRSTVQQACMLPRTIAGGLPVLPLWAPHSPRGLPLWGLFPRSDLSLWANRGWVEPRAPRCPTLGFDLTEEGQAVHRAIRRGTHHSMLPQTDQPFASPRWGQRLPRPLDVIAEAVEHRLVDPALFQAAAVAVLTYAPLPLGLPPEVAEAIPQYFGLWHYGLPNRLSAQTWQGLVHRWWAIATAHHVNAAQAWTTTQLAKPGLKRKEFHRRTKRSA